MKDKSKEKKYCSNCGAKLLDFWVGGEKVVAFGTAFGVFYHTAFNSETGERRNGRRIKCPNSNFWNNCTDFTELARQTTIKE